MTIQINNATLLPSNQAQISSARGAAGKGAVVTEEVTSNPPSLTTQTTEPIPQELEIAVSNVNDFVQNLQRSIHFSVSESSGRTIIEVYDAQTDELIREIPSEEMQRISEAIAEQISEGLFVKINI
ncbi:MAG: flagellar protein FlaG [Pseudomonadales bacterium]|nr:flagellar protein FlaG [Pseudomonadales bacterium]